MPPQPPQDFALNAFVNTTMSLSVLTVLYLLAAGRRRPFLRYEARRPVPWNFAAGLPVILLVISAIASSTRAAPPEETAANNDASAYAMGLLFSMVTYVFIAGGFLFIVAVLSKADQFDLGLPADRRVLKRDLLTGTIACLAALAPVLLVQTELKTLFFPHIKTSGHPLIKMLISSGRAPLLLVVAGLFAVIIAPICEEILFRLLLQGWLEKLEAGVLSGRDVSSPRVTAADEVAQSEPAPPMVATTTSQEPPLHALGGMPRGSFPILVSALLFGLAHYGYGPEPLPLFLLGLVLGYVYQRTHRILPSIVAHSLFNLFTMVVVWRTVFHAN